jgi:dTDP-4-amino-4,6-dideoxygalactose transaminase
MSEILRIAEKHSLAVIEDCAQAVGARYRGTLVGTFGHAAFFSFQLLKGINTYGGGMAVTNDASLAARVRQLASAEPLPTSRELIKRFLTGFAVRCGVSPRGFTFWGFPLQAVASFFGDHDFYEYLWEKIRPLDPFPDAYQRRYSNVQAIVGLRALARLHEFNDLSRAHARRYNAALADCRSIQIPRISPDIEHVYYQFCVYVSDPSRASRNAIRRGVDFETTHVDVCSTLPLFREFAADCPGAEVTKEALQLPVYSRLRASDVERVVKVVRQVTEDLAPLSARDKARIALAADVGRLKRQVRAS